MKKDFKIQAYIIGYGIAILFALLPIICSASPQIDGGKNKKSGYNYKKHYKKSAKNRRKSLRNMHWTGEGCGINK